MKRGKILSSAAKEEAKTTTGEEGVIISRRRVHHLHQQSLKSDTDTVAKKMVSKPIWSILWGREGEGPISSDLDLGI